MTPKQEIEKIATGKYIKGNIETCDGIITLPIGIRFETEFNYGIEYDPEYGFYPVKYWHYAATWEEPEDSESEPLDSRVYTLAQEAFDDLVALHIEDK
jgi:hypothetical protein